MTPFASPVVAAIFSNYPETIRPPMLALRELVFAVAAETAGVGPLEETLKWGEPAYLTSTSRSGSTIRMDWKARRPDVYALYFNCQTDLVDRFRGLFGDVLGFEGNRAVLLPVAEPLPADMLRTCIAAALTYHRDKILYQRS